MTGPGTPPGPWSRPPFEPGNTAALKHGARSPRMLAPVIAELRAGLATAAPWTMGPAFAPAVEAWASAEARVRLLVAYLDEHGILDDEGAPRPAVAVLERAERAAERARAVLGLSPAAWASLYRTMTTTPDDQAGGIEALRAVGRRMIEATTPTTAGELGAGDDGEVGS